MHHTIIEGPRLNRRYRPLWASYTLKSGNHTQVNPPPTKVMASPKSFASEWPATVSESTETFGKLPARNMTSISFKAARRATIATGRWAELRLMQLTMVATTTGASEFLVEVIYSVGEAETPRASLLVILQGHGNNGSGRHTWGRSWLHNGPWFLLDGSETEFQNAAKILAISFQELLTWFALSAGAGILVGVSAAITISGMQRKKERWTSVESWGKNVTRTLRLVA